MKIISESVLQTKKIGEIIAKEAFKTKTNSALVFGLEGNLGSGKTAFTQGFAKGLGIKEKVLSPTFIIFNIFKIKKSDNFEKFYHFDFYRMKNKKEIAILGFSEILLNPKNIIIIEWADKIKGALPKNSLIINFEFVDEKTRKIIIPDSK